MKIKIKNTLASAVGSSLEWFDFALYGFLGPILAQVFFSNEHSSVVALVSTYGVFALGFAARPIGGLIFGYIGDKYGRSRSLKLTPIFITLMTGLMAFIPSYQSVGDWSVIFLIALRLLQGIFLGGEFAGNLVYLCETAFKWRYLFGSLGSCTGSFGIILASGIAAVFYNVFDNTFLITWGWRLAFLLAVPIGLIIIVMRAKLSESNEYQAYLETNKIYSKKTFTKTLVSHKKLVVLCIGIVLMHATSFYFVFVFTPVFLSKIRHIHDLSAMIHNTWFLLLHLSAIPVLGLLVNSIGGRKSLVLISTLFVVFSWYLFHQIAYGSEGKIIISLVIFSLMTAINAAIIPGLLAEIIPVSIRYSILAFSFNISFGIFGGITPYLNLLLIHVFDDRLFPGYYLTGCSFITWVLALYLVRKGRANETR